MRRTAIVTGGARGIGRACALALAEKGFDIALVDLLADDMATTAAEIAALGRQVLTFEADVVDHARAKAVAADVVAAWGRVDFLLNNAGRSMPKGILEVSEEEFDRTIAINLKSCFNYVQAVAPAMLAQGGGRIASMSSVNALSGGVTSAVSRFAYAAAKAGILGMTRALAKELGPTIAVNAICPGVIKTELVSGMIAAREAEFSRGIALGRVGTPQDVAQLVVFLATSEPNFITGQHFVVDGFQWAC
ncbi:3-oxoacyl-[acyl-carrier protein] reductase [Stella humosa]|uniref:3-oxoacyl-[acyl-carrier protein] reductase n=1 Tax=Stella humosa TaxID=94 RepID=A0A3N1L513_9PROT|nr:SDR family NAD(P)-dependent oxidoreductase [Stella humosa]ROP84465.1 3-oxoacyl-[acyl-carrier protein] reductase [Stella humosa]BBK33984.1 beta-ketoacyl-ACP reductase [Stella humosa]